ncbi:hypothetical protein Bca4012_074394 [Brassica carinata]
MIKTMWKSTQDQRGDSSIGFVHYIYWQVIHSFQTHLGALIYPIYGQGELPQAFCCRSAVKGCIYVLRMPITALLLDKARVRLASGQEIFSQKLILDPCITLGSESMSSLTDQQKETLRVFVPKTISITNTDKRHQKWGIKSSVAIEVFRGVVLYKILTAHFRDRSTSSSSSPKNGIGFSEQYKTSPPPSRPKPKTDDVSLIPSLSLVPLVSSSPSDQGSKPKTDDVSLAPHGDSSAFSAETDDRNQGRLCWSSRSLVALLSSSPSDQGSKPKTDDVSLAPHRDSSAFSAETDNRNRGRLCWSSRSPVALLSSSPSDQGSKPRTEDVSLAPHGDSSYFM